MAEGWKQKSLTSVNVTMHTKLCPLEIKFHQLFFVSQQTSMLTMKNENLRYMLTASIFDTLQYLLFERMKLFNLRS